MANRTITIDIFNPESIHDALIKLAVEKSKIETGIPIALDKACEVGDATATNAFYDVTEPWYFEDAAHVSHTRPSPYHHQIIAEGPQVCYIEFGAGIHINGAAPYKGDIPAEIVDDWGEHDTIHGTKYSQGLKPMWSYRRGSEVRVTKGIPQKQGMYFALQDIKRELNTMLKRLFAV